MTASGDNPVTSPRRSGDPPTARVLGLAAPPRWAGSRASIMNRPDIFPVNHIVDHGSLVFRTAEGTKLAAAVLGTAVAYEADGYDAVRGEAWSVVIRGQAVEIERIHELLAATDLPLFPWQASPKGRFVRIEPESITGRRFHVIRAPRGR